MELEHHVVEVGFSINGKGNEYRLHNTVIVVADVAYHKRGR